MPEDASQEIPNCRVCRSEGTPDNQLFCPCKCNGTIKWMHQWCLDNWFRISNRDSCELCGHKVSYAPVYSPDMPRTLPFLDITTIICILGKASLQFIIVGFMWLFLVPFITGRTFKTFLQQEEVNEAELSSDVLYGFVLQILLVGIGSLLSFLMSAITYEINWFAGYGNIHPPVVFGPPVAAQEPQQIIIIGEIINAEDMPPIVIGGNLFVNGFEDNNVADFGVVQNVVEQVQSPRWKSFFGFDGSRQFLIQMANVITLNVSLLTFLLYLPYITGKRLLEILELTDYVVKSHFEYLLSTLLGYCVTSLNLNLLNFLASLHPSRYYRAYIQLFWSVLKMLISLLLTVGFIPITLGWWLDVCTLSIFGATFNDRVAAFNAAPKMSLFLYWHYGALWIYYLGFFMILLRRVSRLDFIWYFIRMINDPYITLIVEMSHLPLTKYVLFLLPYILSSGLAVVLLFWMPVRVLQRGLLNFLPYNLHWSSQEESRENYQQLFIFLWIFPLLMEMTFLGSWLQSLIHSWCHSVAQLLGIQSYLLLDENGEQVHEADGAPQFVHPHIQHIYQHPRYFTIRLMCLCLAFCETLVLIGMVALILPIWLGRHMTVLWYPIDEINDLHNFLFGLAGLALGLLIIWYQQSWTTILAFMHEWRVIGVKSSLMLTMLFGVIPFLVGRIHHAFATSAMQIFFEHALTFSMWQHWTFGLFYTILIVVIIKYCTECAVQQTIETIYENGLYNMNLTFIFYNLAAPVVFCLGLVLGVPYTVAHIFVPLVLSNQDEQEFIVHNKDLFTVLSVLVSIVSTILTLKYQELYDNIKRQRYLIGQRLINYEH